MRGVVILLLCMTWVWFAEVSAQDHSLTGQAQQANDLFMQGNYDAARTLYEMLLAEGVQDSALYFNLGQTYFVTQDLGRALLNYRRAQTLTPRDFDINLAIARVRESRSDILGDETALLDSLAALTAGLITLEEFNWLVLALWTVTFVFVGWLALSLKWRPLIRGLLIFFGSILVIALVLWFSRTYVYWTRPDAVVVESEVQVMSGPGEDYLAIYDLHAAAEMRIVEMRGEWAHFILPDGREGWITVKSFEKI